jgi:hypothetical protein
MRLWSISPEYLDTKGLLGVWREGLLAKAVLEGKTKGYKNHPQLIRFRNYSNPIIAINSFLYFVAQEAFRRGYKFNSSLIDTSEVLINIISVTKGQVEYEFNHLCNKLYKRDYNMWTNICKNQTHQVKLNPIFYTIEGDIEFWEKVK